MPNLKTESLGIHVLCVVLRHCDKAVRLGASSLATVQLQLFFSETPNENSNENPNENPNESPD